MKNCFLPYALTATLLMQLGNTIAQTPQPSFTLSAPEYNTRNYVALENITLTPGFTYKASGANTFKAKVDPFGYTYALPNGTITTDATAGGVVGSIPGQFDVSPSGAATYTIPIEVPAGINGLQPNISLMYNSQMGNGLAGFRTDLSGISAITRVAHNLYYDGDNHGVQFDGNDRFQLDGQHLLLITGATYGSANSVYGTESENFTRITALGKNGDGPEEFKVELKDGTIMRYGSVANSKMILNDQKGIYKWYLNRVEDRNGNYIEYTYNKNADGYTWLEEIKYAGNQVSNFSPAIKIEFKYIATINTPYFIANNRILPTKKLDNIVISQNNTVNYSYKVNYATVDQDERISSITRYCSNGEHLNPIRFEWGTMYEVNGKINPIAGTGKSTIATDIDADGASEIIRLEDNGQRIVSYDYYSNSNNWGTICSRSLTHKNNNRIEKTLDIDNDGIDEIIVQSIDIGFASGSFMLKKTFFVQILNAANFGLIYEYNKSITS